MSGRTVCAVIPAAGKGSRLGLDVPKILVPVSGDRTVWHLLHERLSVWCDHIQVVVAPAAYDRFAAVVAADPRFRDVSVSVQEHPVGMGDAIFGSRPHWSSFDTIVVVWGDQVNLSASTVQRVLSTHGGVDQSRCTLPLVRDPRPYVEYRFASDGALVEVLQSREGAVCRPDGLADVGVFCLSTAGLAAAWCGYVAEQEVGRATGEVNFLPFLPYLSTVCGWPVRVVPVDDPVEARGINTPEDLDFARRLHTDDGVPEPVDRPARVALVCSELPPNVFGGLGRYIERVMRHYEGGVVAVDVFGLNVPVRGPTRERCGAVTVHRLAPRRWGRRAPRSVPAEPVWFQRLCLGLRYLTFNLEVTARILTSDRGRDGSVVAVHDWMGCVTGILCRVFGKTVVFHVHSNDVTIHTTWRDRGVVPWAIAILETTQALLAHRVVVPTSTMRDMLVARGWKARKIDVIAHGYDDPDIAAIARLGTDETATLRADIADRYLDTPAQPLLVYAGRLAPMKGVFTLLEAMALLPGSGVDPMLLLIGNESPHANENAAVRDQIDRLDLRARVIPFFRFLDSADLYGHFLAADVCVFPSSYEPFGLVAVEAMALARPVVLGRGYAPEIAGHADRLTLQCTTDAPRELADLLHRALTDSDWSSTAPARAQRYVRQRFTWARTGRATLRTYADARA